MNKVDRFIEALYQLESAREEESIVSLFDESCKVGNVLAPDAFQGREGAREFWKDYRSTFGEIHSDFRLKLEDETHSALEWTARGTSPTGTAVEYDGVSMLEYSGDRIIRFHAYFDPKALGRQFESKSPE